MKPRIVVFCNNRMGFPSIQMMAQLGVLTGVVVSGKNKDVEQDCKMILAQSGIPILSVTKASLENELVDWLTEVKADYCWLLTFPWKIPAKLINNQHYKFYNFHFGLLPEMKGVDPIFECIRRGKKETGITVHEVTSEIDGGDILAVQKIKIDSSITHGILCSQMGYLAQQLAVQLLSVFQQIKSPKAIPQSKENAVYYGKPGLTDVMIQWKTMDSSTIDALTRSCNPWNKGAYSLFRDWSFRILSVTNAGPSRNSDLPGTVFKGENNECLVQTADNNLLKINLIYTEEGFLDGSSLFSFGVNSNDCLT